MNNRSRALTNSEDVAHIRRMEAERDAAVAALETAKADAWDEGWKALEMWTGEDADAVNPYRKNESTE